MYKPVLYVNWDEKLDMIYFLIVLILHTVFATCLNSYKIEEQKQKFPKE